MANGNGISWSNWREYLNLATTPEDLEARERKILEAIGLAKGDISVLKPELIKLEGDIKLRIATYLEGREDKFNQRGRDRNNSEWGNRNWLDYLNGATKKITTESDNSKDNFYFVRNQLLWVLAETVLEHWLASGTEESKNNIVKYRDTYRLPDEVSVYGRYNDRINELIDRLARRPPEEVVTDSEEDKIHKALGKIFNDWYYEMKKGEEVPHTYEDRQKQKEKKQVEKWTEEWKVLRKNPKLFPWWVGRVLLGFEKDSAGNDILDSKGDPIPKYDYTNAFELDPKEESADKYIKFCRRFEKLLEETEELKPPVPPYIGSNGKAIWTYEQWKLVLLSTNPDNYLEIDDGIDKDGKITRKPRAKLTYLSTFIPEFFEKEGVGIDANHLRDILNLLKIDLIRWYPEYWKKVEKYADRTAPPPTAPEAPINVKKWLDKMRDFINFTYLDFPKPIHQHLYLSDVNAILFDLETLLNELGEKWLWRRSLFYMNDNTLWSQINTINNWNEQFNRQSGTHRQKALERLTTGDSVENPLMTFVGENNKNWERFRAFLFKSDSKEHVVEGTKFDDSSQREGGGKGGQKGDTQIISRQIDPRIDPKLLQWVIQAVKMFLVFKDVRKILDKHFWDVGRPIFAMSEADEDYLWGNDDDRK
jgi:hypothetical protein